MPSQSPRFCAMVSAISGPYANRGYTNSTNAVLPSSDVEDVVRDIMMEGDTTDFNVFCASTESSDLGSDSDDSDI